MATANFITPSQPTRNTNGMDTVFAELDATISILSHQPETDTVATAAMIHASTARALLRDMIQGHPVEEPVVIPNVGGVKLSSYDVRGLLNQTANAYPELRAVMDASARMIISLETLRHEATLPLALGNLNGVDAMLKQKAVVEVSMLETLPGDAATAIHHIESARDILQRIGANVASAAVKREVGGSCASLPDHVDLVMEMAEEVKNQQDRLSCVMLKLLDHLSPPDGEEARDIVAQRLAEMLCDQMADARREINLINTIRDLSRAVQEFATHREENEVAQ